MANTDIAIGFLPHVCGGNGNPVEKEFFLDPTAGAIGKGAPVILGAGGIIKATVGDGNPIIGIAAEFKAATVGGKIKVWDDTSKEFYAQLADPIGDINTEDDSGANVNFVSGAANSLNQDTSELAASRTAAATGQFKLMRILPTVDNDVTLANAKWIVRINNHQLVGTGTAAV